MRAAALALAVASLARAQTRCAVLDAVGDAEAETRAAVAGAIASEIAKRPALRLVPLRVPLQDAMFAVGCNGLDAECLRGLAQSIEVGRLFYARVSRHPAGHIVAIEAFGASGSREASLERLVPGGPESLRARARTLAAALLDGRSGDGGVLRITSPPGGADVTVDGLPVGKAPVILTGVAEGEYRIEARGAFFSAVVVSGAETEVHAAPARAPAPHAVEARVRRPRLLTWIALGLGVAAGGAAVYFALDAREKQKDYDACIDRGAQAELPRCHQIEDRGQRAALLTNVSLAATGAALVTGGVLLYFNLWSGP